MQTTHITYSDLILRPYVDTDAEEFSLAVRESVDTVSPWLPWCSSDFDIHHALAWFDACRAQRSAGTAFEYGVFSGNSGEFLGGAGLNDIRQQHQFCNLGYWVRQSRQRQGIASRSVQALCMHAFAELGLQRVEIVVAVGNTASERVAVRAGALRESVARNRLSIRGKQVPAHIFSLVPG